MAPEHTGRMNRSIDFRSDLYPRGRHLLRDAHGCTSVQCVHQSAFLTPLDGWSWPPSNEWLDFPFENNRLHPKYSLESAGNNLVIGDGKTKLSLLVDSDSSIRRGGAASRNYADFIMKPSAKTAPNQIRVIIADDHPVVLAGLAAMLRSQKDIKVVAEATDGAEVCKLYDQLSPDVLMLDLRMPKKDGLEVVTELMSRPRVPKPRIIVMTTYESEEDVRRALRAGAKGYLVKGAGVQQIR